MKETWLNLLVEWNQQKKLIQVVVLESRKAPCTIYGNVLQVDHSSESFLLYNTDTKTVHNISLNRVDSIDLTNTRNV